MPKVSCIVFHVLLVCLLPLMCLIFNKCVDLLYVLFCALRWLFHLVGIAWHNHTIDLFSSTCQHHQYTIINYVWALFNHLLRMNQHRLHPQPVFSSKALHIHCVRPPSLCSPLWHHAGLVNGLSVPSSVLSSQLGEMRDCLVHWRMQLSRTSATVMELRSPHCFSLKQHEARQCTDTRQNQWTRQRDPCWGPCNLKILL